MFGFFFLVSDMHKILESSRLGFFVLLNCVLTLKWDLDVVFDICSVGDYAGEDGVSNYSQQFKNLDKLVKKIDGDILSKLDGSAKASSSSRR